MNRCSVSLSEAGREGKLVQCQGERWSDGKVRETMCYSRSVADPLAALAAPLASRLMARGDSVAVSESSSGGLISATLLSIPGASAYFLGGGVIYTQVARRGLLGVPDDAMHGIRSSTEAYALLKARAVRARLGATWGLAETGAAGPTGNRYGDAAGHTCVAVAGPIERARTLETGRSDREANMWAFTRAALELLESCVMTSGG
jgi:nicotinamide-nucleotide amidase